jgi:hypothetical protein
MSSIEGVLANIAVARLRISFRVGKCGSCKLASTFSALCCVAASFSLTAERLDPSSAPAAAMLSVLKLAASCEAARLIIREPSRCSLRSTALGGAFRSHTSPTHDSAFKRSGEEAVLAIGVSRTERLGVIRRIRRTPGLVFMPPEWLRAEALDENYFRLLPSGQSNVTTEEAAMLAAMFGEGGELPARQLS